MKEIIKEEFDFIDEIIERTKESDYINLLARKRKARLRRWNKRKVLYLWQLQFNCWL